MFASGSGGRANDVHEPRSRRGHREGEFVADARRRFGSGSAAGGGQRWTATQKHIRHGDLQLRRGFRTQRSPSRPRPVPGTGQPPHNSWRSPSSAPTFSQSMTRSNTGHALRWARILAMSRQMTRETSRQGSRQEEDEGPTRREQVHFAHRDAAEECPLTRMLSLLTTFVLVACSTTPAARRSVPSCRTHR